KEKSKADSVEYLMYHCTPSANTSSIARTGLSMQYMKRGDAIYFGTSPFREFGECICITRVLNPTYKIVHSSIGLHFNTYHTTTNDNNTLTCYIVHVTKV